MMHIYWRRWNRIVLARKTSIQHGVVLGDAAATGMPESLSISIVTVANGSGRVTVSVGLTQRVVGREGPVAFAVMDFESGSDRRIKLFIAMRIDQFVHVLECQAGQKHFLRDATLSLELLRLSVDGVLVRRAATAPLRRTGDEQRVDGGQCLW